MNEPGQSSVERLSEQQKKCLRFVHQGLQSKEIAPLLDTTPGVVDNYISAAIAKLGAGSRREAARMLYEAENEMVQRLHMQSEAIAQLDIALPKPGQAAELPSDFKEVAKLPLGLPRLGGPDNELTVAERVSAIAKLAFILMVSATAILIVARGAFIALR